MKQSKVMSLTESLINIAVGLIVAMVANAIILPLLGFPITLSQNAIIAVFMTVVSIARSFALRRLFEALHIRIPLTPAMIAVIAERRRQVDVEGWTLEHDDKHLPGEMAIAGATYALHAPLSRARTTTILAIKSWWPWDHAWFKPQDFRRDLIRASALIIAEIDRFDRNRKQKRIKSGGIINPSPLPEIARPLREGERLLGASE